jgi:hypothetical protein
MDDATTYRRYAEDCQRLAATMPRENQRLLLEMAHAWLSFAQEVEGQKPAEDRDASPWNR